MRFIKTLSGLLIAFFLTTAIQQHASAQDDSSDVIRKLEVISDYKPITQDAYKVRLSPYLPSPENRDPDISYETPTIPFNFAYQPTTSPAISFPARIPDCKEKFFVKGGFGIPATPLLETYYNSCPDRDFQFGAFFKHRSTNGTKFRDYADNSASIFGKKFFFKNTLTADLDFDQNKVYYYGTSEDDTTTYTKDDLRQRYTKFGLALNFYNHKDNVRDIDYNIGGSFYMLSNVEKTKEQFYKLDATVRKSFDSLNHLTINTYFAPTVFRGQKDTSRIFTFFEPIYTIEKPTISWKLKLGINATFENASVFIAPNIYTSKEIFEKKLVYYTGWHGYLNQNTFSMIATENPFIGDSNLILMPTKHNYKYTGVEGTINKFHYNLQVGMDNVIDQPLFVNDANEQHKFAIRYDDIDLLIVKAEAAYELSNKLKLSLLAEYNNLDTETEEKAWHLPELITQLGIEYNMGDKLLIASHLFGYNNIYTRVNGETIKLNNILDANVELVYAYRPNLSIFLNVANLTTKKYIRWYNFPNYGLNVLAGLSFSF